MHWADEHAVISTFNTKLFICFKKHLFFIHKKHHQVGVFWNKNKDYVQYVLVNFKFNAPLGPNFSNPVAEVFTLSTSMDDLCLMSLLPGYGVDSS